MGKIDARKLSSRELSDRKEKIAMKLREKVFQIKKYRKWLGYHQPYQRTMLKYKNMGKSFLMPKMQDDPKCW